MFHCSVAEMLGRVSSAELTEWNAYYQLQAESAAAEPEEPIFDPLD